MDFEKILSSTSTKNGVMSAAKQPDFKEEVLNRTSEIDSMGFLDVPFTIRCQYLRNGKVWPTCQNCDKPVGWIKSSAHKGWNKTCSHECKTKKNNSIDIVELSDKDYLWDQRFNLKKSYDQIASELGCSAPTVQKAIESFGYPKIRYNESSSMTMARLKDKNWLVEQHVNNHRTLNDIANEIGSSPASISRYLQIHGIEANDSNSYERDPIIISKGCHELGSMISHWGFDVQYNRRFIMGNRETDILIESKKLAIEYNGLYYHCYRPELEGSAQKGPSYHYDKTKVHSDKGYTLIHIYEDEWHQRKKAVESVIKSKLGICERIFARKCKIVEIPVHVRRLFLDTYHLQGDSPASICFGLEYEGKLVCLMSFSKSRFNKTHPWELVRFCSSEYTVVGGFSKLLNHFRNIFQGSIVSYADLSHSVGNVYQKNGFRLEKTAKGQFWYVDPSYSKRLHRSAFMKKRISPGDPRSEQEIMSDLGYKRLYGPGVQTWILD